MRKSLFCLLVILCALPVNGCQFADPALKNLPPGIESFTVNPPEITKGGSALLNWSVSGNAGTVTIEPGIGSVPVSGSIAVTPLQKQSYTITATNKFGTMTSALTVNVTEDNSQTPLSLPVIYSFIAQPEHGPAGIMVELTWDTEDADTISIQWGDKNSLDFTGDRGSFVQQPVVSTTYTLIAKNRQGVRATNVSVTVDRDLPSAGGAGDAGACG